MTDQPPSGNRWEPTDTDTSTMVAEPGPTPAPPPNRTWRQRLDRPAAKIGAGAVVLALAAGGAGFALGHASADGPDLRGPGIGFHPDGPPGQGFQDRDDDGDRGFGGGAQPPTSSS